MAQTSPSHAQRQILHRPRLNALIHEGLKQPLLIMLAGPGYGKTVAISSYVEEADANVLWLRLSTLDNLPDHFWAHLLRALNQEYPALSGLLRRLALPRSLSDFSSFIQLLEAHLDDERETIWIFDDYGGITNQQVKDFVGMLVDADVRGFHLVLLSNVLDSTESIAYMTRRRSILLSNDFRFTSDEISALYQLHGNDLLPGDLKAVERYTEGWPLALNLLALERDRLPDILRQDKSLTHHTVAHLFEERYFAAYPARQQKLIVKLSMLDSFTTKLAISIYDGDPAELEMLENHAFLIAEPASDRIFLHHLYRLFLSDKAYLLDPNEEKDVWRKAAGYHMAAGNITDAVACYRKGEDYMGMMEAVYHYIRSQSEMTESTALYFLEHIALLTHEQLCGYPRADYMRAYVYMILVRLEESEALLLDLEERLLSQEDTEERQDLLCDVYATLGIVHMMQNKESFAEDFRRAADAADHVSPAALKKKSGLLRMHNGNAFSMADNGPDAKERMERVVHQAAPYMEKIWSGDISGIEYMFSAESAYLSYRMEDATGCAYQCAYKAEARGQYDLVCNAHRLLARIGYVRGDYGEMKRQIEQAVDHADRHDNSVMRKIRDTALAWYYVKLQDHAKIPQSIMELSRTEVHNLAYGRPQVTYAHYLLNTGEYARMVGMMRHTEKGLYLSRGIWQERIIRDIMLAIGYHRLGNLDASMDALWSAYDLCYNNGLVTLFIEAAQYMNELIGIARQQNRYAFSPGWLDFIEKEAAAYALRAKKIRAAYRKEYPVKASTPNNPLSKRERSVLQAIAQGLTREEVAVEQYVTINTVKSTLRNIYNKLEASNKTEAVSIAIRNGYIDGMH